MKLFCGTRSRDSHLKSPPTGTPPIRHPPAGDVSRTVCLGGSSFSSRLPPAVASMYEHTSPNGTASGTNHWPLKSVYLE